MKNKFYKALPIILCCALTLTGCSNSDGGQSNSTNVHAPVSGSTNGGSSVTDNTSAQPESSDPESSSENTANSAENESVSENEQSDGGQSNSTDVHAPVSGSTNGGSSVTDNTSTQPESSDPESSSENTASSAETESISKNEQSDGGTLNVAFGNRSKPFTLNLYDNPTAAAIKRHVGTADWQLPIYHYDDYDNWEVMQYYDVPSRYEIPDNSENITSEKAGEVYYSEPNRIVLFYGDAEVSADYTKVGYFDFTEEFKSAVKNNPVLEGWGNKLVFIMPGD